MTSVERVERELTDIKQQMDTMKHEEPRQKRSGYWGLIGAFIIGLILGLLIEYFLLVRI